MRLLALVLLAPLVAQAAPDPRYCTAAPVRASDGKIARSRAVLREFKAQHPCPSTGIATGPCPGWAIDHVIPLAACGCDSVANLQWLPVEAKAASGPLAKDRWERRVYRCPAAASGPAP